MPRKAGPKTRRLEFTLFKDGDPVLHELEQEAEQRGVSLQQHIYDLLRARYLARHGDSLAALLWTPDAAAQSAPEPPAAPVTPDAAGAAASAWLDLSEE